jgi:hypothetical protein
MQCCMIYWSNNKNKFVQGKRIISLAYVMQKQTNSKFCDICKGGLMWDIVWLYFTKGSL